MEDLESKVLGKIWKENCPSLTLDSDFVNRVILVAMREFHKQKLIELEDDGMIKLYFKII